MSMDLGSARQAVWKRRLREFERSSETVGEFCDRVGASVSTFYRWQRKLSRRSREDRSAAGGRTDPARATASPAASPAMSFLPIAITAAAQMEVQFPNGARVSVPCHDHEVVRTVLTALVGDTTTFQPREDDRC